MMELALVAPHLGWRPIIFYIERYAT